MDMRDSPSLFDLNAAGFFASPLQPRLRHGFRVQCSGFRVSGCRSQRKCHAACLPQRSNMASETPWNTAGCYTLQPVRWLLQFVSVRIHPLRKISNVVLPRPQAYLLLSCHLAFSWALAGLALYHRNKVCIHFSNVGPRLEIASNRYLRAVETNRLTSLSCSDPKNRSFPGVDLLPIRQSRF